MSYSNEILELWRMPPPPQLEVEEEEPLVSDPVEQLIWSPEEEYLLSDRGETTRSLPPIPRAFDQSSQLDYMEFDYVAINPQNTDHADDPPPNQLLNISGIGPSQSTTSFSPSPANASVIPSPSRDPRRDNMAFCYDATYRQSTVSLNSPLVQFGLSQLTTSFSTSPANANVIRSPSRDPLRDNMAFHHATICPQSTFADNPPRDQLLNTSGIGPSQATASFSPPANANEGRMLELRPTPHLEEESVSNPPEQLRRMEKQPLQSDIGEHLWSQPPNPLLNNTSGSGPSHPRTPPANANDSGEAIRTIDINIEEGPVSEVISALWLLLQIVGSLSNHQDDTAGEKQKQQRDISLSIRRKRAKIPIPYETLLLHSDKTLEQAAKAIGFSESKLKYAVQDCGFSSWSDFKFKSKNDLSGKATHLSRTTSLHGGVVSNTSGLVVFNQCAASSSSRPDENNRWRVTVMAAYRKRNMMFDLFPESKKEDLEKEVMKRVVDLQVGSFYLDYKNEAGVWIYIGCDEDLKRCMDSFRSSNRSTPIEMVVQLND